MTKLIAYRIHSTGQKIVAGRPRRKWMDETHNRYAYRCLPLTIANAMGWEILMPAAVSADAVTADLGEQVEGAGGSRPEALPEAFAVRAVVRQQVVEVVLYGGTPISRGGRAERH